MKITFTIPPEVIARIFLEEKIKAVKALVDDLNRETDRQNRYHWQQHEGCVYILKGLEIIAYI